MEDLLIPVSFDIKAEIVLPFIEEFVAQHKAEGLFIELPPALEFDDFAAQIDTRGIFILGLWSGDSPDEAPSTVPVVLVAVFPHLIHFTASSSTCQRNEGRKKQAVARLLYIAQRGRREKYDRMQEPCWLAQAVTSP